uniref:Core protein n=1 Tax=Latid herpesvirus 1 TaxID=3096545 RepID=A0AB33V6L7_9VIRU
MALEISQWNFVTDHLVIPDEAVPLYLFFSKKDLLNPHTGELGFGNLQGFQRQLFKLFCWLTSTFKGEVLLCYLEQIFISTQVKQLSPALRCSLSSDVVVIFLLKKAEMTGDTAEFGFLHDILAENDISDTVRFKDRVLHAVKKFIAHHMMLISKEVLYTSPNAVDKMDDIVDMVDWSTCNYKAGEVKRKVVEMYGGCLYRTVSQPEYEKYTALTILSAAARYFLGGDADHSSLSVDPDFAIWGAISKFFDPGASPLLAAALADLKGSPCIRFLEGLATAPRGSHDTSEVLLFRYDLMDLFCVRNFRAFEGVPLLGYPFAGDTPVKTLEDFAQMSIKTGTYTNTIPPTHIDRFSFKLLFPHLAGIRGMVDEIDQSRLISGRKAALDVKIELFKNILIKNSSKITVDPITDIYGNIKKMLSRNAPPGLAMAGPTNLGFVCGVSAPDTAPRVWDNHMLRTLFVEHLGVTRCSQATLEFSYIIHNTAPRWKLNRIMIVNHTRPGQGKTFTNEVLMALFAEVGGIFEELSNFTTTSFKYTPRCISKVMLMDDVGFTPEQQKMIAREDNIVQNHFKCMLDKGYTNNNVTQWNQQKQNYNSNKIISIQNTGFIWNTNTLAPFGGALKDRSLILGPEPLTRAITKGGLEITKRVADAGLGELAKKLFLRQHLIQTIIYTLTDDVGVHQQHVGFLRKVIGVFEATYPSFKQSQGSLMRDDFKILEMALADALRLALSTVLDLWIPPWTEIPEEQPGETVGQFMDRLNVARLVAVGDMTLSSIVVETVAQLNAFLPSSIVQMAATMFNQETVGQFMDRLNVARLVAVGDMTLSSIVVETVAQLNAFLPSSIVQMAATMFNQETGTVINRVCEFLDNALRHKKLTMSLNDDGTLRLNNPAMLDGNFEGDLHLFKAAKSIMVQKNVSGETALLVTGFTSKDKLITGLHMDGGVIIELFKTHNPRIFERLWGDLMGVFAEDPEAESARYIPGDTLLQNILTVCATSGERGLYAEPGDRFLVNRIFRGLHMEILRRELAERNPPAEDGFIDLGGADLKMDFSNHGLGSGRICAEDMLSSEGTRVSERFLRAVFQPPAIRRFSASYINNEALMREFTHCRATTFAMGNVIKVCRSRTEGVSGTGWEYALARDVYSKYAPGVGAVDRVRDVSTHMTRYLCSTRAVDDLAADDPYFAFLRGTATGMSHEAFYGGSRVTYDTPPPSGNTPRPSPLSNPPSVQAPGTRKRRKLSEDTADLVLKIQRKLQETPS